MARALCSRCERRTVRTSVPSAPRDAPELLGLRFLDSTRFACAECGQEYMRDDESEYLDPDRVTSHFDMVGLSSKRKKDKAGATVVHLMSDAPEPRAAPPQPVEAEEACCPRCGSTRFGRDAFLSDLSFAVSRCDDCGHSETVDVLEPSSVPPSEPARPVEPPVASSPPSEALTGSRGCEFCSGDDAARAWKASGHRVLRVLNDEPHDALRVVACDCGQAFLERYSERVRFDGEGDDVTVIRAPLHPSGLRWLESLPGSLVTRGASTLLRGRALVSEHPLTGHDAWWRAL